MVNKQLIEYIQNNLDSGYSRDPIKYVLIENGYTEQDIQDAFAYVEEGPKSKKRVAVVIAIIFIVIIAVNIWYFKPFMSTEASKITSSGVPEQTPPTAVIPPNTVPSTDTTSQTQPTAQLPLVINPVSLSVKLGEGSTMTVSFINNLDNHNFRLEISGSDMSPEAIGLTYDNNSVLIERSQTKEWTLSVSPQEGSGVYVFNAKVSCTDCETRAEYTRDFIIVIE